MDIYQYIDKIKNMKLDMTYKVITFGCQMNAKDSEKIEGMLFECGFKEAKDEHIADIVVFNTCTVRENANNTLYGHVGDLKKDYKINKNKIICICGCMMQEKDEIDVIKERFPYVKIIFGTYNIHEIPELLYNYLDTNKKIFKIYDEPQGIIENLPTINKYPDKCGINISYGCNNFCTYCIVPYVRGRERSRDKNDIIKEIKYQIKKGVKEIMLLGQNVNSYGLDNMSCTFPELLNEVAKIDGIERIRFMSSHPKDFSDDLINVIKENDNIVKHIHLPVQSGSDRILTLMNRKYTRDKYLHIIDNIKSKIPDISLTTDIIVGFPTETEDDFKDTLSLVEYVKYDSAFTFMYSKRNGTIASTMDGQIPEDIKSERFDRLLKLLDKIKKPIKKSAIAFSIILSIFTSIILSGCGHKKTYETSFFALDTIINIKVFDYDNTEDAITYLEKCKEVINENENRLSKTIETSDVYNINHGADYRIFSSQVNPLIDLSMDIHDNIDDSFDIRIGKAINLWTKAREDGVLPDDNKIKNIKNEVANGIFEYDLGAIAKGYIADELYFMKDLYGIKSGIINLGGNVYVIGDKNGHPFTVGIDRPFSEDLIDLSPDDMIIDKVEVVDKTVVTSGIYQRYLKVDNDDRIYHHILDANNLYPSDTEVISATVVSDSSLYADILATILVLHDIEDGKIYAKKMSQHFSEDFDIIIIDKNYNIIKYSIKCNEG